MTVGMNTRALPEMLRCWTAALKSGEAFEMTFPLRRGSEGSYRILVTRAEPLKEKSMLDYHLDKTSGIVSLEP